MCDFAKEMCESIDELIKEKADLNEKLADLKDTVKCSDCGKNNSADAIYCTKCGAKLNNTIKNNNIEFEDEPIAEYSDDIADSEETDAAEVIDDTDTAEVKKVITIKAKKTVED